MKVIKDVRPPAGIRRFDPIGRTSLQKAMSITVVALTVTVGCDRQAPMTTSGVTPSASALLNSATPASLVGAFRHAGLPVGAARNVTAQRCPTIHCSAEVDTDDVAVLKFPATGLAEKYEGSSAADTYQVEDVVLVFRADLPAGSRTRYENLVTAAVE
jgi:hypothetical protein